MQALYHVVISLILKHIVASSATRSPLGLSVPQHNRRMIHNVSIAQDHRYCLLVPGRRITLGRLQLI